MGRFYGKVALNVCLFVMVFYGLGSSLSGLDCMLPKHLKIHVFTVGPSKRVRQVEHREFILGQIEELVKLLFMVPVFVEKLRFREI